MQQVVEIPAEVLFENPWHFRIMSDKDYSNLKEEIKKNGIDSISLPIVANISGKYLIVDGHSRVMAIKENGISTISCKLAKSVKSFEDLRLKMFQLNREGFSNPLHLSDMFYEDMKLYKDSAVVAARYNITEQYLESLLLIKRLNDDTKNIIQKIIHVAKKKYQFLLNQISPQHLAHLSSLTPQKQLEVVDWIFRDIMYGPTDESLVSIPSVSEIINEIEEININTEKKKYEKNVDSKILNPNEFHFACKCGLEYDIDIKSKKIHEYVEHDNIIIKKESEKFDLQSSVFSSNSFSRRKLIQMIKDLPKNSEFRLIINENG